jgi:hypothetical protein
MTKLLSYRMTEPALLEGAAAGVIACAAGSPQPRLQRACKARFHDAQHQPAPSYGQLLPAHAPLRHDGASR